MENIRIAVQKSGRLQESSLKLLKECGLKFSNGQNKLKAQASNFPAEVLFLRDDDIPEYVQDGVADLGIVGENVCLEKEKDIKTVQKLGFAKCRLSLAVPKNTEADSVKWFDGKRIATSYPVIVKSFLKKENISAEIHEISGSVEIAPGIGLADAICDIVSTGSTLLSNGLKESFSILKSEAVLISSPKLTDYKTELLNKILFRIKAVNEARNNKYILLNAPNHSVEKIASILPGMKSPTVLPLKEEGWSSIHSVVDEGTFWDKIDQLKAHGAQGILVVPIEKMIL
ncbi:MAG: ATP phosphoribosyltransferase [Cyclobacteriaceae bacterium]|nr:ATP phosphoribosyltransferase [Cyclobacteriaceae bacterium]